MRTDQQPDAMVNDMDEWENVEDPADIKVLDGPSASTSATDRGSEAPTFHPEVISGVGEPAWPVHSRQEDPILTSAQPLMPSCAINNSSRAGKTALMVAVENGEHLALGVLFDFALVIQKSDRSP